MIISQRKNVQKIKKNIMQNANKRVIDFFIDYEIKSDRRLDEEQQAKKIKERKDEFAEKARQIVDKLQERLKAGNT